MHSEAAARRKKLERHHRWSKRTYRYVGVPQHNSNKNTLLSMNTDSKETNPHADQILVEGQAHETHSNPSWSPHTASWSMNGMTPAMRVSASHVSAGQRASTTTTTTSQSLRSNLVCPNCITDETNCPEAVGNACIPL